MPDWFRRSTASPSSAAATTASTTTTAAPARTSNCFSRLTCTNLVMLASVPDAGRCSIRYPSLAQAKSACIARADCGGVVLDNGMVCDGQLRTYELRDGKQLEAAGKKQCIANAWALRREEGAPCAKDEETEDFYEEDPTVLGGGGGGGGGGRGNHRRSLQGKKPNNKPAGRGGSAFFGGRPYSSQRGGGSSFSGIRSAFARYTAPTNMREYFQSHWNPGTFEGFDCARMRRVGPPGDGGKMVCYDAIPMPPSECFVLSVGVGGDPGQPPDFRFEVDLHRRFPHCSIHVYDGTNFGRGAIKNAPRFVKFYPENFAASTADRYRTKKVDLFKIDCEGCEFSTIQPVLDKVQIEQFNLEVHGANRHGEVARLMGGINRTHGIYYKEPNIQHSDGTCIEFAFRHRHGAKAWRRA